MTLTPLERHCILTLLGVRFWDRLTNRAVTDGLQVTAQRLADDRSRRLGKPVLGRVTPNGTIAFFDLLVAEEPRASGPQLWNNPPPNQLAIIDVIDRRSQFLPLSFVARLPFQGIFCGQGDWLTTSLLRPAPPAGQSLGVQLWSSSSRASLIGQALVQTQLVVGETDDPAAFALVRVQSAPPAPAAFDYFGMADHRGIVVIPMPYPSIPEPEEINDKVVYPPLNQQTFPLQITVHYRESPEYLPGSSVPNLESLLNQPQVNIGTHWNQAENPALRSQSNLLVNLQFGQTLILRTALAPGNEALRESVLRIVLN